MGKGGRGLEGYTNSVLSVQMNVMCEEVGLTG